MADNISFDFESVDFESAVDEVDILVPKYLDSLEALERADHFSEVPALISNVVSYWNRLRSLLEQIQHLETDVPIQEILQDALQSELSTLEKVYLPINLRVEFSPKQWTPELWDAAETVLARMDTVLSGLGFDEDHEDRQLVAELIDKNLQKKGSWQVKEGLQDAN